MTDEQRRAVASREIWPELPFEAWQDTYDTLQLWTQIVGKVRLAKAPDEPLVAGAALCHQPGTDHLTDPA